MHSALRAAPVASSSSEHELVAAVRAGDDRAFGELYARYRGRISGYIRGMVGDHARAEDIAQDAFISALRRLRATDRPIAFKAWIYEIAKNACIDEFRRTRRAREVPLQSDDEGQNVNPALISPTPTPESALAGKQALRDLRGAFHGLSENHHKVLVMRELEGLSYSQIGDRMGMSKPAVESALFRARRQLTDEYDELVSGRRCERVQTLISTSEAMPQLRLGLRERRQLARHLSHCQPCRRSACLAGVDESLFHAPSIATRIAALLPWLRWHRGGSGSQRIAAATPVQALARYGDMIAPSGSLGRVVAAIAAVAAAGAGGGAVSAVAQHDRGASSAGNAPPGLTRSVAGPRRAPHKHHASARAAPAMRPSAGAQQAHKGHAKGDANSPTATASSSSSPAGTAGPASGSSANPSGGGASSGGSSSSSTHHTLVEAGGSQGGGGSVSVSVPAAPKVKVSVPKAQTPSPPAGGGSGGGVQLPRPAVPVPRVQVKLP